MRALTLWQPWAWAVASGIKRVENRKWEPHAKMLGQRIAIHASMKWDKTSDAMLRRLLHAEEPAAPTRAECLHGVILGTAVIDCVVTKSDDAERIAGPHQKRWFFGPYGWILRDIQMLVVPIACRGYQKLWTVSPSVERALARGPQLATGVRP